MASPMIMLISRPDLLPSLADGLRTSFPVQAVRSRTSPAIGADAEKFHLVSDFSVAALFDEPLQGVGHAKIHSLYAVAFAADNVVMVLVTVIKFVPHHAITKLAAPHQFGFLQNRQGTINGDEIAAALLRALMDFLDGKRPVILDEHREYGAARLSDPQSPATQGGDGLDQVALV